MTTIDIEEDEDMEFHAAFTGQDEQRFPTLQSAMAWAQELQKPTGTISFQGKPIVRYSDGNVNVA